MRRLTAFAGTALLAGAALTTGAGTAAAAVGHNPNTPLAATSATAQHGHGSYDRDHGYWNRGHDHDRGGSYDRDHGFWNRDQDNGNWDRDHGFWNTDRDRDRDHGPWGGDHDRGRWIGDRDRDRISGSLGEFRLTRTEVTGEVHSAFLQCAIDWAHGVRGYGNLKNPTAACQELAAVGGDINALNVHPTWMVPEIYAPVRAEAFGRWRERDVTFSQEFPNGGHLTRKTGDVFDF